MSGGLPTNFIYGFFIGAISVYIISSKPEIVFFQVGGVYINTVYAIPPLISGLILLIYTFCSHYKVSLTRNDDAILLKSRKQEISIKRDEIQAVKVRDAGKFAVWFVFVYVNLLV